MSAAFLFRRSAPAVALMLAGCAGSVASYPSLAPRTIERDAAVVPSPAAAAAVAPAVAVRAAALAEQARAGDRAFVVATAAGCAAIGRGLGATEGSEAWVAAQQALSAVDAARNPTAAARDDLDALVLDQARLAEDQATPVDLSALLAAAADAAALDDAQRARFEALRDGAPNGGCQS